MSVKRSNGGEQWEYNLYRILGTVSNTDYSRIPRGKTRCRDLLHTSNGKDKHVPVLNEAPRHDIAFLISVLD
jgi:hypothetical protein